MKINIIFLSCLCSTLAITVHQETTGTPSKSAKEYKTTLKDIRLVPSEQSDLVKPIGDGKSTQKSREEPKTRRQNPQTKFRGDKKKLTSPTARIGNAPNYQNDPTHQYYMQKMANQLYVAQKHASLLSDYQKFIISQDEHAKKFVLAQTAQDRSPKPFSKQRPTGRSLSQKPKYASSIAQKYVPTEPVTAANVDYKKIVVVTPKVQTTAQLISKPQNDHSAQATQIKYVTLAPQLTHFVETHEPSPKVTLVPYHAPEQYTYYDLGVTHKPVEIPTTASLGLGAYESPKYYEGGHETEEDVHHHNTNYEFMYNVKDHEKQNNFGHKESRTDKTTYGFYFVHLPDGRLETVKYWADKTGYHAKVDYQGEAKHPSTTEHKFHGQNFLHH